MSSIVDIGVIKADQKRMYETEGCGICEKQGAEVFWFSRFSRCAHTVCFKDIENIEADLIAKIETIFDDTSDRNMAHIRAVEAVKKVLGPVSIKTFLETEGATKLKLKFNSVGQIAALILPAKL